MIRVRNWLAVFSMAIASTLNASTPDQHLDRPADQVKGNEQWLVNGGEFKIRFNRDLLAAKGVRALGAQPTPGQNPEDEEFAVFPLVPKQGLQFNAPEGGFDRFTGGTLGIAGDFGLKLPNGQKLSFRNAVLRHSHDQPMRLELVGDDGQAWLYLNHLMYKMVRDDTGFFVRSADLRASAGLAYKIGRPELADEYVGEVKMLANVVQRPYGYKPMAAKAVLACPDFHGTGPANDPFQTDVLMESYSMSGTRCRNSTGSGICDGPASGDDGDVVFTPSSTLRNSNKSNTADVPWYQKFTTSPHDYPYENNDQHPYLIWNMYRIVDGQLEQIGASGVKHAFLTTNTGCAVGACTGGGHILGKNCGDTYGTSNNDSSSSLGPRSELIPATGQWARCNSIYDDGLPVSPTNMACDGNQDSSGNTEYMQRMVVKESKLVVAPAPAVTQFFSESWYIVQDDVNIYNTMAHRSMTPNGAAGSWSPGTQGSFVLGPVLNTWVDPTAQPTQNVDISSTEGHARVAVKVRTLDTCPVASGFSGTCYRYDYVVHNFDFARVQLMPPPNDAGLNLGLVSSQGYSAFKLNTGSQVPIWLDPNAHFADIDVNAGNNWLAALGTNSVTWTAPASNQLKWGMLYRFSFITTVPPNPTFTQYAQLAVSVDEPGFEFAKRIMVPNVGTLFDGDFE